MKMANGASSSFAPTRRGSQPIPLPRQPTLSWSWSFTMSWYSKSSWKPTTS